VPEHLKALVVILVLSTATFAVFRRPACGAAILPADFSRRRNLWLALTLLAFLAHNFWIYIFLAGAILLLVSLRDPNKSALYFFVLFALPQISVAIPGFGIINQFFVMDYVRLLALVVLLPAAYSIRISEQGGGKRMPLADKLLIAYLLLNIVLQFMAISITGTMRNAFYAFIDVYLPYYVLSRSLRNLGALRDAVMSFVTAAAVLSTIGFFEFTRHWLLYHGLDPALGVHWDFGGYLEREDSLRAMATTGQPIVLGYVVAVAFGLFLYAGGLVRNATMVIAGFGLLLGGLIAPLSRGPWIGAAIMLPVYLVTGHRAVSNFGKLAVAGLLLLPALYMTPYWEKLVDFLPFVGSVDEGNITYRQRLLEIAWLILLENPLFGSSDFIYYMEELRQGQGIIDIVNSYLIVALRSGFVGLGLFLGFFGMIAAGIVRQMRIVPDDSEIHRLGQALLAVLAGILVMIFTVSSINAVPVVYWAMAGVGMAYAHLPRQARGTGS
jgi:hypothetical protein